MRSWLVNQEGYAQPELPAVLDIRVTAHRSLDDASCIRVTLNGRIAHVTYSELGVHTLAAVGTLRLLVEFQPDAVAIVQHEAPTKVAVLRSQSDWLSYIGNLAHSQRDVPTRICRTLPLALSPFFERLDVAREIFATVSDAPTRLRLLDALFQGMYTLVRQDTANGLLKFEALGSTHIRYDEEFARRPQGKLLTDGPDPSYGAWVAKHYLKAFEDNAATADEVDATISWTGKRPTLHRYTRLMVPISCGGTDRLMLSAVRKRFG